MSLTTHQLDAVTTAGMLYEKKPKTKICDRCGKEIVYQNNKSFLYHFLTEHNPMKNPEVVKKNNPASHTTEVNDDIIWVLVDKKSSRVKSRASQSNCSDSSSKHDF